MYIGTRKYEHPIKNLIVPLLSLLILIGMALWMVFEVSPSHREIRTIGTEMYKVDSAHLLLQKVQIDHASMVLKLDEIQNALKEIKDMKEKKK